MKTGADSLHSILSLLVLKFKFKLRQLTESSDVFDFIR